MINILAFVSGGVTALFIAWLLKPLISGFIAGLAGDENAHESMKR